MSCPYRSPDRDPNACCRGVLLPDDRAYSNPTLLFLTFHFAHLDEVANLEQHALDGFILFVNHAVLMTQAEGFQRPAMRLRTAIAAANLRDLHTTRLSRRFLL